MVDILLWMSRNKLYYPAQMVVRQRFLGIYIKTSIEGLPIDACVVEELA